jgi:hypothetical protein
VGPFQSATAILAACAESANRQATRIFMQLRPADTVPVPAVSGVPDARVAAYGRLARQNPASRNRLILGDLAYQEPRPQDAAGCAPMLA